MSWFGFGGEKPHVEVIYPELEHVEDESQAQAVANQLLAEAQTSLSLVGYEELSLGAKYGDIKLW